MAVTYYCPICGEECEIIDEPDSIKTIKCKSNHNIRLLDSVLKNRDTSLAHMLSMITYYCITHGNKKNSTENGNSNQYFKFYYDENSMYTTPNGVNVYPLMKEYPRTLDEKLDRILLYLSEINPNIGDYIDAYSLTDQLLFCNTSSIVHQIDDRIAESGFELETTVEFMKELEYIEGHINSEFRITRKGWLRIEELLRERASINQGFIAMSFADETKPQSEAIKKAIDECGYSALRMDESEHNNQIVPELFFQIERSKFLVIDVTVPNYGAYYEAGYALALKKEVIVCCSKEKHDSKDEEDRPHFDIAQKAMVVWESPEELVEKLKKRIEATVGLNN
jgi:nucleoside 2-deoxyribosyltransferase